ncbi:MAG TPA: sialidase family protein [Phycisphaerae bacterium]|nr:sialidase family protein [Phycisphaerae bacterium]
MNLRTSVIMSWAVIAPVLAAEPLLTIEPSPQYPRHSEGDVIEFQDGRLVLIYTRFTGGAQDHAQADIVLRTADAAGKTWDEGRVLIPRAGADNVMSVSTVQLPGGEWLLFYLERRGWDNLHMFVRRTSDEFRTLSEPVRVTVVDGYHVVNNDRVIRTSAGRLIVPAALHPCSDGTRQTWSPKATPVAFLSDDEGRTWRRAAETVPPPADLSVVLQEPGVVELKDGRICMWLRTSTDRQYVSFSVDGGEHWSTPEPGPLISAQYSPASIRRIAWSGDLVCVWNDHSAVADRPSRLRTPLAVSISRDDGRTWSPARIIENDPDGWYCYTSISFIGDRMILSYCAGDKRIGGLNRLRVTACSRDWLESIR